MSNGENGKRLMRELMRSIPEGYGWSGYETASALPITSQLEHILSSLLTLGGGRYDMPILITDHPACGIVCPVSLALAKQLRVANGSQGDSHRILMVRYIN